MEIKARIPGTIVAINVKPGDTVKARDNLGTMEAMKMAPPLRKRTPSQIYQKGCQERLWAASGVGDSNGRDF